MEIEEVAAKTPGEDPQGGRRPGRRPGRPTRRASSPSASACTATPAEERRRVHPARSTARSSTTDCSLLEINPLVVTKDGEVLALDAKINFDDNALFRHPDLEALRDLDEEDPAETEAKKLRPQSFIKLDGNIGCMVNGAGLAMATMDIIKLYGGEPANFLDVGGGATDGEGHRGVQDHPRRSRACKAIFVNIFGGIMKCDMIAEGVIAAVKEVGLKVPLVVRLEGTNVELGKKMLARVAGWTSSPPTTWPTARRRSSPLRGREGPVDVGPRRTRTRKLVVQGITGTAGRFHAKQMRRVRHATSSAASRRARAAPGRSREASRCSTPSPRRSRRPAPTRRVIFVPPPVAADAILEAAAAGHRR